RQALITTALSLIFFAALCITEARVSGAKQPAISMPGQETDAVPAALTEKIRALGSTNPIERASAACQIGEMGRRAAQAIPHLIRMLADDTPISTAIYCGERSTWRGKLGDEPTTP